MPYQAEEVLPGVWQILDPLNVCTTLLCGEKSALLIDTGHGLTDLHAFVATLTRLPLRVILTHGHFDHALGARWFPETEMFPEDLPDFAEYTALKTRQLILGLARDAGVEPVGDYLTAEIPVPRPLEEQTIDLGGLTAQVIRCPGHTPGSAVLWVKERQLLLTGDDWNPCTWLFFPSALPAFDFRRNMEQVLALPFRQALCSHRTRLYDRSEVERFFAHLTPENLAQAGPAETGWDYGDQRVAPMGSLKDEDMILVFDRNKCLSELNEEKGNKA